MTSQIGLTVDVAFGHALVVCDRCNWRTTRSGRAAAWTAGAVHLKQDHGDVHAAYTARQCARVAALRMRSQSSQTGDHGNPRPTSNRRKPAAGRGTGGRSTKRDPAR